MSKFSRENIKNLTKSKLKTDLSKQDLSLSRRKENLTKRFMETLNDKTNNLDKPKERVANALIDMIK